MVRRRWAAAVVLLASVLLLHLFAPGPAPDGGRAVGTAVAVDAEARGEAPGVEAEKAERLGDPDPCEADASISRLLARSPRTAGAAGASHALAGVPLRPSVGDRDGSGRRPARAAYRPWVGDSARSVAELQTFRC